MKRIPVRDLLDELGAEPVDGSGFEEEESESSEEVAVPEPEVAR